MPSDFRKINKYCEYCNKLLILNNSRDVKRKRFCSKSCMAKHNLENNILGYEWGKDKNADEKIKQKMRKPHTVTKLLLKVAKKRGLKKRKSLDELFENGIKFCQTSIWKRKRLEIYKRDNYTCQDCKKSSNELRKDNIKLNCHHIIPIDKGGKLLEDFNLITLCKKCHAKKHSDVGLFAKFR